ncbi:MAG: hypothetical protein KJ770_08630 [Actinobacteria bacterium]|nr:hypothetical protein [Actinomycetota bacterium]MCG2789927.1 hypothetical protein [Actinomycetes bacterium]
MKKKIPKNIIPCLWSYNIDNMDLAKDKEIIITQVLNYGDAGRIKWLYSVYTEEDLKEVVSNPRRGRWFPKVLNFWEIILKTKIPKKKKEKAIFKLDHFLHNNLLLVPPGINKVSASDA